MKQPLLSSLLITSGPSLLVICWMTWITLGWNPTVIWSAYQVPGSHAQPSELSQFRSDPRCHKTSIACHESPLTHTSEAAVKLQRLNLPELGLPAGPYSHAVTHERTLYTSGFTAYGTAAQAGSVAEQVNAIFEQFEVIAGSQNTSLANIVKVTIFLADPSYIPELREALVQRYGPHIPASSMVMVGGLFAPELAVEIEAVFAL